jgi:thioredoxin-related protein
MKQFIFILFISFILLQTTEAQESINWVSLEEAEASQAVEQRTVLVYMTTDWCGWCKRMERETFSNPTIVDYINKNYYAVKFNAEGADEVVYKNKTYINQNPEARRHAHDLARLLMQGRMSYPTVVYLDGMMNAVTAVPGFFPPERFEPVINYYGSGAYRHTNWEKYKEEFDGSL